MKLIKYIYVALSLAILIACDDKYDNLTGIGVNSFTVECLSCKIDSMVVVRLTNVAPDHHSLSQIDVRNPYGLSWGTVDMRSGKGEIVIRRDTLEKYALKSSGKYTLTPNYNEIQIPNVNFISIDDPRCSCVSTLLIPPAAAITLQADVLGSQLQDTTKIVGTLYQSEYPVYFQYSMLTSELNNPKYKLDEFQLKLYSKKKGKDVILDKRQYSISGDTVMIKGIDYQRDDEMSLKMHVRMGDLTDDVVSLAYKVNRWVFDNETKNRILSPAGNLYFNLMNGRLSATPISSPRIEYIDKNQIRLVGNADTLVTAVKYSNDAAFKDRDVYQVINKYNQGTPPLDGICSSLGSKNGIAVRLDYKDNKGQDTHSWALIYINAIGTSEEADALDFSYQYRPKSY